MPLWKFLTKKGVDKVSRKLFNRSLTSQPHDYQGKHPLTAMRAAWLKWALSEGLLETSKMHSGKLYNEQELKNLISQNLSGSVQYRNFLDHVITLEMAMRTVGTGVD